MGMPEGAAQETARGGRGRGFWLGVLAAVIAAGLLSRVAHTGFVLIDKYLGDALYAAMVYALLRMTGRVKRVALWAGAAMVAIECFQLTGIPAGMMRSGNATVRGCARLLGTEFGVRDLLAYAVGIAGIFGFDAAGRADGRSPDAGSQNGGG